MLLEDVEVRVELAEGGEAGGIAEGVEVEEGGADCDCGTGWGVRGGKDAEGDVGEGEVAVCGDWEPGGGHCCMDCGRGASGRGIYAVMAGRRLDADVVE